MSPMDDKDIMDVATSLRREMMEMIMGLQSALHDGMASLQVKLQEVATKLDERDSRADIDGAYKRIRKLEQAQNRMSLLITLASAAMTAAVVKYFVN